MILHFCILNFDLWPCNTNMLSTIFLINLIFSLLKSNSISFFMQKLKYPILWYIIAIVKF
jgi:uncharacterized membrane protein